MANLSAIYRISADISGLQRSLDQGVGAVERFGKQVDGAFKDVKNMIAGAFTVGAVIDFTKEILHTADELQKLSDQTGVSVIWLQKFQVAAGDAGVSIDEVAMAISRLQKNLGTGSDNTVKAVQDLGLQFADLKAEAPQEQMLEIAQAIGQIPDPLKQAEIGAALFGRQWMTIMPLVKRGIEDVRDASVAMSGEAVATLDTFGDALTRLWRNAKGLGGRMLEAALDYYEPWIKQAALAEAAKKTFEAAITKAPKLEMAQPFNNAIPDPVEMVEINYQLEKIGMHTKEAREEAERLAKEWTKTEEGISKAQNDAKFFAVGLAQLGNIGPREPEKFTQMVDAFRDVGGFATDDISKLSDFSDEVERVERTSYRANFGLKGMVDGLEHVGQATPDTKEHLEELIRLFDFVGPIEKSKDELRGFGDFLKNDFGKIVLGALEGGGNVLKSIGGGIGGFLFGDKSSFGKSISDWFSNNLGSFGKAIGSILPGIGTLIGGGLGALFGKLFSNPEKEINPIRQAFVDAAGGLDKLNQKAHEAGVTLNAMLNAKNAEQYKKAIDDLNEALNFQTAAMKTLDDTIAKYGFTIDQLGPKFAAQKLNEQAAQLLQDYEVLSAAGIDHNLILEKMGPNLSKYVQTAMKAGIAIPMQLKPIIEDLAAAGDLTDEAGNKMTDLGNLKWAETLDQEFSDLLESINKLVDAINRGLGNALTNLGNKEIHIPIVVDDPTRGAREMASGGMGRVTRPTLFLAGEAGPEDYAFSGAGRSFGGNDGATQAEVAALRASHEKLVRYLTTDFRRDVVRAAKAA